MNTRASSEIASILLSFEAASDGSGWLVGKQDDREVFRPTSAAEPAPTQSQGSLAISQTTGSVPASDQGHEKAQGVRATPAQVQHVQPATPRWGFTLPAFNFLRSYAKFSFPGNARQRGQFELATPQAAGLGWMLDVADIVLDAAEEVEQARQRERQEAKKLAATRRAKRSANRREGGGDERPGIQRV